jgi:hypothetical protein
VRLLDAAEIAHLARQPTAVLAATARTVTVDEPIDSTGAENVRRAGTALGRQIDLAMTRLDQEPAGYLVGLLGRRPQGDRDRRAWRTRAHAVEDYRHRTLGLPYGQPAGPDPSNPRRHAIGPRPDAPPARVAYDEVLAVAGTQPGLDL